MNLVSCENCGVVLDRDNLIFPIRPTIKEDGSLDDSNFIWDRHSDSGWIPAVPCPVCKGLILKR